MRRIFVGNLDFNTREDQIRALFRSHGAVERVSIAADWETGHSRGFAFVEMADDRDAKRAVKALDGASLNDRSLKVYETRPAMPTGFGNLPHDRRGEPQHDR